jgi:hypothetical protein
MLADGLRWVKTPLSFAHDVDYLCGVDVAVGGAVEAFAEGDGRFGFQVADLRENVLAHFAFGHKPVGDRHRAALFVMGLGVSAVFAGSKFFGKGSMPTSRNAVKFFAALFDKLMGVFHAGQINTD